jgi:hypothetical protein
VRSEELVEGEARLGPQLTFVEVPRDDRPRLLGRRHVQRAEQVAHIVQVVELLAQPHGRALHRQQVLGPGHEHLEMRQVQERIEVAPGA